MHEKYHDGVIVTFTVPDNPFEYIAEVYTLHHFRTLKFWFLYFANLIKRFNFERKEENNKKKRYVFMIFQVEALLCN